MIPFRDADQALRYSYRRWAQDIVSISQTFTAMRGGSVRLGESMDVWEHLAQAALVISFSRRVLSAQELEVLEARYIQPVGSLASQKELCVRLLSYKIFEEIQRKEVDRWYVCDLIRQWAGLEMKHPVRWWIEKDGISQRRAYKIRSLTYGIADARYQSAIDRLSVEMQGAGLIP